MSTANKWQISFCFYLQSQATKDTPPPPLHYPPHPSPNTNINLPLAISLFLSLSLSSFLTCASIRLDKGPQSRVATIRETCPAVG